MIQPRVPESFRPANGNPGFEVAFYHDGSGILDELHASPRTSEDVRRVLVDPLAGSAVTVIDWCIKSTGQHNCRTRHNRHRNVWNKNELEQRIGEVVQHYATQEKDLLDLVLEHGHRAGMKVFGNVRLNTTGSGDANHLWDCPGRNANGKKDFRDPVFHDYLCEIFEDLLAKGVDGISLDFERKAPFFSEATPQKERFAACREFLEKVRALTSKPVLARVSHDAAQGEPQGQQPELWIEEGLVDIIVPATHNHDPDPLDWGFERFLQAAGNSPNQCQVWPQIWPTHAHWGQREGNLHSQEAILRRVEEIRSAGAHGVYFFNFCCFGSQSELFQIFREIPADGQGKSP
jgi:hypothetical protein